MNGLNEIRPGESRVAVPPSGDAEVWFIGTIHTPWPTPRDCPRRGDYLAGPLCRIEVFSPWDKALAGLERHSHLQILYWMNQARRDLVIQNPRHTGSLSGTFSLRSPNRPNPIASSLVVLERVDGNMLYVRGLDCVEGTPLIDIKPETCPHDGAAKVREA